ncbi:PREDICTED: uncharacterized protein LOC109237477 [Nicotiana attenuata]|uniref:uncharacterized protein LOC109237477 n=1 Tax=Nicotiana attenuata TaxID=49451 RepID=UPI000905C08C|nr:PREDICTED: uncharacterized protein LOC109237477 [Nicotiana attenuata]
MLADYFIKVYAGARKVQARKADIFRIAQWESELLREFVTRFQKERILLPAIPDEWATEAFTKGLNLRSSDASRKLKESLLEFQVTTWTDVHNRYESKIRIEDDQVGFPSSTKGREKNREKSKFDYDTDRRNARGQFFPYEWTKRRGRSFRTTISFPLTRGLIVVGTIEHCRIKILQGHWILLTPSYQNTTSTDNAKPSNVGKEPPRQTINMIFGGNEINGVTFLAPKKAKVSITHSKRLWEDDITFTKEDADVLLLPHNDALVIYLNMLGFKIKRVLVDPGSSANIIQWRVFEEAKLTRSIIPAMKLLARFSLASVTVDT